MAKLFKKDQKEIVRRLQEAGIDATADRRDAINCAGSSLWLAWRDGCWNGHHFPGFDGVVWTADDLAELIRLTTAPMPEPTRLAVEELWDMRENLEESYYNLREDIDQAVRVAMGCPRAHDEIVIGRGIELGEHAHEIDGLMEGLRAPNVEAAS